MQIVRGSNQFYIDGYVPGPMIVSVRAVRAGKIGPSQSATITLPALFDPTLAVEEDHFGSFIIRCTPPADVRVKGVRILAASAVRGQTPTLASAIEVYKGAFGAYKHAPDITKSYKFWAESI